MKNGEGEPIDITEEMNKKIKEIRGLYSDAKTKFVDSNKLNGSIYDLRENNKLYSDDLPAVCPITSDILTIRQSTEKYYSKEYVTSLLQEIDEETTEFLSSKEGKLQNLFLDDPVNPEISLRGIYELLNAFDGFIDPVRKVYMNLLEDLKGAVKIIFRANTGNKYKMETSGLPLLLAVKNKLYLNIDNGPGLYAQLGPNNKEIYNINADIRPIDDEYKVVLNTYESIKFNNLNLNTQNLFYQTNEHNSETYRINPEDFDQKDNSNEDIFKNLTPLLDRVKSDKISLQIFTYGLSGSGKTFTTIGKEPDVNGILQLSMKYLIEKGCKVKLYQIYAVYGENPIGWDQIKGLPAKMG